VVTVQRPWKKPASPGLGDKQHEERKMKKAIAAAAGLMLVGAMVGTASAAVSFSGDARARLLVQENYDLGKTVTLADGSVARDNEKENKVTSRVRLNFRGEAEGGAYVVARVRAANGTWGDGGMTTVDTDRAYVGVPMGNTLLNAGRLQYDLLRSTSFFEQDKDVDGLEFRINATENATFGLWYFVNAEGYVSNPADAAAADNSNSDNDISRYGGYGALNFSGGWATRLGIVYEDNQQTDNDDDDGVYGGIEFMGPAGPLAMSGALAFDDRLEDTGYGAFLKGGMNFGATSVALNVGFTKDGFVTDGDFGFIMLGGGQSMSPGNLILGVNGDTWWVGVPVSFAVSEMLTLQANLAYADFDEGGDGIEISGSAIYKISDGCSVDLDVGYFAWSEPDDIAFEGEDPFGAGLTFNVSF
jgi:hypothetical protein